MNTPYVMFGVTVECTVNPKNGFLKRSKCNPGGQSATGVVQTHTYTKTTKCNPGSRSAIEGVQKLSHMLVPMKRPKLPRDEQAASACLLYGGSKENYQFLTQGQN